MKKKLIIFSSFLLITLSGRAQYNTVEKIRAYYTKINLEISAAIKTKTGKYCNEVNVNFTNGSWPGLGSYKKKIGIWYSNDPVAAGDGKPEYLLDKVNITGESAGNQFSEEYLFANGELLFYSFFDWYTYNGTIEKDEYRVYFSKGKVLKYDLKSSGHNDITRAQSDVQTEALRHSKVMMQLFLNSCEYTPDEIL